MASPLAWFRKNQKGMLIFFGVLLMAVFGLPSVFFNMTPQSGADPEMAEVVVKFRGGSFTRGELRDYRYRNAQAIRFIQELQQAAANKVGIENFRPRAALLTAIDTSGSPEMLDRQVMRRLLLKKKSDELGMSVGDNAVLDYLQAIANDDNLDFADMKQFAFDLFRGNPDFNVVKEQLKKEIAYEQMIGVVQTGLPRSPNITDAWENFLKLNDRRGATVLEFPVSKFEAEVTGEPKLSDLREIFAKGEYEFPDLSRENPGFKAKRKLKAVVLTADYDTFLTNAESSIKPEDIQKLYDEYVEAKNPLVMELVPKEPAEGTGDGDDPAPEFNLQGEGDAAGEDEGDKESTGDDEDASKKSEESSDGDASEEEAGNMEGENSEGENSEGEGDDGLPPNGPSAGDLQEDEDGQKENTESADQKSESADEATESETPQENTEVAGPELPGGAVPVPAGPPVGSQDGLNIDDLGSRPDMRVRELDEELSKILRRELARVPANNAMATALTEAAGDIGDYGSDLNAHESTKEGPVEEREPMPDPIDLDDIARDYKLQLQETELMNYDQLRLEPIGQLGVTIQRMYYGQPFQDRIAMAEYLFGNYYQLDEWVPETVVEYGTNNQHIVFFVGKEDTKVRSFDEARDDVVAFWRHNQALEIARAEAQITADEVNSSGQMLTEKFPEDAKALGEFSWNSTGQIYPTLDGSVRTGPEFMETTFGLELNKSGVAADATKDHIYAIQLTAMDPRTNEEMQELFFNELSANSNRGGMSDGINRLYEVDTQQFVNKMFADINEEYEVKWLAH